MNYCSRNLKAICFCFSVILSVFSAQCVAKKELVVAVGLAKPPYVLQQDNKGFEIELIQTLLSKMGYSTRFVFTTFGHSSKMLEVDEVDAVMTTNSRVFVDSSKLTNTYITYQNVAVSLKANNFVINSIPDLGAYSLASFQKADKVLGKEFAHAVDRSPLYFKVADQSRQPKMLIKGRVSVLVMDVNIFKYFAKQMGIKNIDEMFTFHHVFPPSNYQMAFKNKDLIPSFNQKLASYIESEEYQKLKNKYDF